MLRKLGKYLLYTHAMSEVTANNTPYFPVHLKQLVCTVCAEATYLVANRKIYSFHSAPKRLSFSMRCLRHSYTFP